MPSQAQITVFILQQEAANSLLRSWAEYADASGTRVPPVVCRAVADSSAAALELLRAE